MNPLVELITAWDVYSKGASSPLTVEAFCEFYLNQADQKKTSPQNTLAQELAKVTGRLSSIHKAYLKIALKDMPGIELEWYFLLNAISQAAEVRKTEVVSINLLLEPTTCIDILNRMIKLNLLNEKTDPADKRVRLLSISNKGQQLLMQIQQLVDDVNHKLYGHIDQGDQKKIIGLLAPIEKEHTGQLLNIVKKKYV